MANNLSEPPALQKTAALMAAARAYLARGAYIQYDQLSMDRLLRVTPRHNRFAPPEEATCQHTLFLDCSSFVNAVYYTVFGCELEADVTWNMMELVKPMVYDYRPTHRESERDRQSIRSQVLSLLQPGDCVVMRFQDNGHIILCGEDGFYYHCTERRENRSYHYDEKRDFFSPDGAIYRDSLAGLFEPGAQYDLLGERVLRFVVLRPLERMGEPTAAALARLEDAAGLQISALSSHSGGRTARLGEAVAYTVQVQNLSREERRVSISLEPAPGFRPESEARRELVLAPGQTAQEAFSLTVSVLSGACLAPPAVKVNGLPVWAERVLLHGTLDRLAAIPVAAGPDLLSSLSESLGNQGLSFPSTGEQLLSSYFMRYDSAAGDVLWRRPQEPWRDGALYSYFGGTGVITPEAGTDLLIRTKRITSGDLQPGDIILCSDDALFTHTYASLVTPAGLEGRFAPDTEPSRLWGEPMERFVDSLPGRFCYVVVRPGVLRT